MRTKKEFRYFTIFNHEKEQDYLRDQQKQGWKFVKVTGIGTYHFEECTPEDVIYQLDFNQETGAQKEEYLKMFADCGWEYIQEFAGYSYFRKAAADMKAEEEIFCDESSRLAMLERVYKGKLLPMFIIFNACLLPQFIINTTSGRYFVSALFGTIIVIYAAFFMYCALHYNRKKKQLGL